MQVEFKDIYKIGIPIIDEQHKSLFDMFNEFEKAYLEKDKAMVDEVLSFLIQYCEKHFKTEELYFEKYDYPQREEHKALHDQFIEEVNLIAISYRNGSQAAVRELECKVYDWLIKHIEQVDKRYGMFLIEKMKIEDN